MAQTLPLPEIRVSTHAANRWIERVDGRLSFAQALHAVRDAAEAAAPCVHAAAGTPFFTVKLGNGARLVFDRGTVVTVLARGQYPPRCAIQHAPAAPRRMA